jgi:hypothetical protein
MIMTESETEAETIERLEVALRRIADLAQRPRRDRAESVTAGEIDRAALIHSLDMLITRLRTGLKPANPSPHLTE